MRWNRPGAACVAALTLMAGTFAVRAEPINWRQTSVAAGRDGQATLRRGVAILGTGEPVTMTVRLEALEPPKDGRMLVENDMSYRFDDGSTLRLKGRSAVAIGPDGRAVRGESRAEGKVLGGSGRFQGATGTYRIRTRTDVDAMADGALGDYFAVVEAEITLPRAALQ